MITVKKKILSLLSLGILVLVLFLGGVNTLTLSSTPSSVELFYQGQSKVLNITNTDNDGNFDLTNNASLTVTDLNNKVATFTIQPTTQLNVSSAQINISLSSVEAGFAKGTHSSILILNAVNVSNSSLTDTLYIPVSFINSFCKTGPVNDTDLNLEIDIKNRGKGEENEWLPLDTIEVEVKFKNDKNIDLDNVIFELGLYKKGSSKNIIGDMIWISEDEEKVEVGDIDEGKSKTHVFKFRIDPSEVGKGDYILMVKAYPEGEESETCIDYSDDLSESDFGSSKFYAEINIKKETDRDKMVIIDTESLPLPIETLCGEEVVFTADVYNIGDRDFEDQIAVSLYNKELGVDLKEVILGDLDEGDKTEVTFIFRVPSDAEEKIYTLYMRTYYDYDEDDDEYKRVSYDSFPVQLKVAGECIFDPKLTITASLVSGGKAGQELVVKAVLKNTDSKTRTFSLGAGNYNSWAELVEINPTSLTLNANESKDVLFTFNVNREVSGEQTFNILVNSDSQLIATQPVSEILIEKTGFGLITGNIVLGENWYLWGIGALNIILVIVIIVVAVRLVKKK